MNRKWLGLLGLSVFIFTACSDLRSQQTGPASYEEYIARETLSGHVEAVATGVCDLACQYKRSEFRYVVYVGKQIYCYWDEKKTETGRDFDALAKQLETSIITSTTATEYYQVLRSWASAFHDGHVNVLHKDDRSELEVYTAPIRIEVLAPATDHEQVIIVDAKDTDQALPGDEIQAIDGVPISEALTKAETQVSGSTKKMRRFFAARRLLDVLGASQGARPLMLTLLRGGKTQEAVIQRTAEIAAKPDPTAKPSETTTSGAEKIKALILPGSIGYLKIDAFVGEQSFFLLDQAMQRLSGTKGLLIDLRTNGGGDQSGNSILARLTSSQIIRYKTSERMDDFILHARPDNFFLQWTPGNLFADWHDLAVLPKVTSDSYVGKPVVALTSPNCFSACDTFASALKSNGLATLMGENTGGGTGSPLVFELPVSGHQFRYSVVRGQTAQGLPIEGVGTAPDVMVEPTASERFARKDLQLVQALKVLHSKVAGAGTHLNLEAEVVRAQAGLSWAQSLDLSPTASMEIELKQIAKYDEL